MCALLTLNLLILNTVSFKLVFFIIFFDNYSTQNTIDFFNILKVYYFIVGEYCHIEHILTSQEIISI